MEEPVMVPEDLSSLSDEELSDLGTNIRAQVEGLADAARDSDETLAQVETLIGSYDVVQAEGAARAEASEARQVRLADALGRFAPEEGADAPAEDAAEEEEGVVVEVEAALEAPTEAALEAPVVEVPVEISLATTFADSLDQVSAVVEAAVETAVSAALSSAALSAHAEEAAEEPVTEFAQETGAEAATDSVEELAVEESATAEMSTEAPAEEVVETETLSESDPVQLSAEAPVEASIQGPTPQEGTTVEDTAISNLNEARPDALAPQATAPSGAAFKARGISSLSEGQSIDISTLAKAIVDRRIGMGNVPTGTFEFVTLASAVADHEFSLNTGAEDNFSVLSSLQAARSDEADEANALVASGGVCAPLEPDYSFFRLADELNPVERCLPVAQAPRGGIRYIQPPDFRDAAPGVRITTEAEDAAGYVSQGGPTPNKPCTAVVCPPIQECRVDAVSRCVTFGNLNYRVFPEQVEAFLADLSVIFTETKEIFYLDAIDAASTAVTHGAVYGATRSIVYDLLAAAANYRRRHHMNPDATLDVLLPSWVPDFLKVDMVNDHALGLNFLGADMSAINQFFAQANLNVCWYYDSATGAGQAFNDIQAPGAMNEWPDTVVSYLFAPGTFVRLDAGTLDVGLVRDSLLNSTNDLQLFAEQWVQVCMVGLESLRIEHTLCPNGTAPEPVPPFTCPGGVS